MQHQHTAAPRASPLTRHLRGMADIISPGELRQ
jgi:hypothetical protein